ncbi:MAG TPA: complex I NDUFA9 subunit family protein [bacterium]|nr:complex I NDUFA9 subunit family protein [bacterium]HOL94918.1 complex I NDUFA9 subunit family protein [bacterium]HPP01192.1 complex I NDUFA9 subunit family protein [bacterium]HXK94687.1 complex I NDUFA9 subunit family protein [bacterium]
MKVFVTGAAGFAGQSVVRELLEKKYSVRALIRQTSAPEEWKSQGVEVVQGDLTQPESLKGKLDGCGAVINLAGRLVERGEQTFHRLYFEGTRNLVESALSAGIKRFVHMSALGARPAAASRYHLANYMAEQIITDAPVIQTIFRPSVIFGPGSRFCRLLVKIVHNYPVVPVITSHHGCVQPIYVNETARAVVDSLERAETFYQTYELGGPTIYSMRELLKTFADAFGKTPYFVTIPVELMPLPAYLMEKYLPNPPFTPDILKLLQENLSCDTTRIRETFGIPQKPMEECLREHFGAVFPARAAA